MTTHFRNHPLAYYGKTPQKIGDGTYSRVYKYKTRRRKGVAVKVHNNTTAFIREIALIDECKGCPHIVDMLDVGYDSKRNKFYHVMPLAENDLYHQIYSNFFRDHPEKVKQCIYHLLQALSYIHIKQYLHRDIKAENVLAFRETNGNIVYKLCDFGLSRKAYQSGACYTSYMVTLYYRPPENLLDMTDYTYSIDVWSAGCILAELILGQPPFDDDEAKTSLDRQLSALGSEVNIKDAPEYLREALSRVSDEELKEGKEWWNTHIKKEILESEHSAAYDLIEKMLVLDPSKRISVREALLHPYFSEFAPVSFPLLPVFKVYEPEDWSHRHRSIEWKDRNYSFARVRDFLKGVEVNEIVFVKTVFLFNLFANCDDEGHLDEKNLWPYILVISRIASKLCCGDPISLNRVTKFILKRKAKERTRYFLNKIHFNPGVYTGYDWLLEPRNVSNMKLQARENGIDVEEEWERLFQETGELYISTLFSKEIFYSFDPKEVAETCYTYIIKTTGNLKPEEIPENHKPIHKLLETLTLYIP